MFVTMTALSRNRGDDRLRVWRAEEAGIGNEQVVRDPECQQQIRKCDWRARGIKKFSSLRLYPFQVTDQRGALLGAP